MEEKEKSRSLMQLWQSDRHFDRRRPDKSRFLNKSETPYVVSYQEDRKRNQNENHRA
jgi:hypothetical protein